MFLSLGHRSNVSIQYGEWNTALVFLKKLHCFSKLYLQNNKLQKYFGKKQNACQFYKFKKYYEKRKSIWSRLVL